ncbi:uncharacterized protein AB675_6866 [Cyphellophora attinorum]|uniref:Uncharacterized protein n=1 Tax=Cyphellophora attinorum TaxID=1664694 RepID=A0A0N0NQ21_9EURO|nr:uncharacterized protein AB675_6866 [Phialophora attinorum]KPI43189.1 hypothetical protein AB675_6866 [Phialophora attinorum]
MDRTLIARRATRLAANCSRAYSTRQRASPLTFSLSHTSQRRYASTNDPSKPIVLEQPDQFRPPSHGARLAKSRSRGSTLHGAYNQSSTNTEREAQKKKSYPHMFPEKGTFMNWFLTNKVIHIFIAFWILIVLSITTWLQTFAATSPFGHLLPAWSTLPFHPLRFFSDFWTVYIMHMDYNTEQVEFARARNVLDAQKRRIYRRAHGMEDLDRDEDQGVDVRGIVPWDDGLTKKERAAGGIGANRIKMASVIDLGPGVDKDVVYQAAAARRQSHQSESDFKKEVFIRRRQQELGLTMEDDPAIEALRRRNRDADELGPWTPTQRMLASMEALEGEADKSVREAEAGVVMKGEDGEVAKEKRKGKEEVKKKLWLGIW